MEVQSHPYKKFLGWLLLIVAACLTGVALSSAASLWGWTDFPDDRRGEWAALIAPLLAGLSFLFWIPGSCLLVRSGQQPKRVAVVAVLVVGMTVCGLSWQFGYATA
jgi:hypothetical protein